MMGVITHARDSVSPHIRIPRYVPTDSRRPGSDPAVSDFTLHHWGISKVLRLLYTKNYLKPTVARDRRAQHKHLDPITGQIDKVAENLRSLEEHFGRASIPCITRDDNTAFSTSLAMVNSVAHNCHILTLS